MRKIITILLLFVCLSLQAQTYYHFATAGNDVTGDGSIATPYQTITKANNLSLSPGDSVVFKRGDTFYGTLIMSASGTSGSRIVYGAYSTVSANDPIITGFTTLSSWTNEGGGIYSKAVSCASYPNIVTVDGVNVAKGRYPNTSYVTMNGGSETTVIDSDLPDSPSYIGADVVIRKTPWVIDVGDIDGHSAGTLTYTRHTSNASGLTDYPALEGYGYFIQDALFTLDATNEWYYNGSKLYIFGDPAAKVVKVATLDEVISNSTFPFYNYITLDNLNLQGANVNIIHLQSTSYFTIQNCNISYSGREGIFGFYSGGTVSDYFTLTNCTISEINNTGVFLDLQFHNVTISNNTFNNIAYLAGMGGTGDWQYNGIYTRGYTDILIEHNTLTNIGYMPIAFYTTDAIVRNNYINTFCNIKDDGGGIYTQDSIYTGREIRRNIVLNGIGAPDGKKDGGSHAHGIYLDNDSKYVTIDSNTVANISGYSICLNSPIHITVTNNTVLTLTKAFYVNQFYAVDRLRNLTVNNNIFLLKKPDGLVFDYNLVRMDLKNSFLPINSTYDYNYYARPLGTQNVFSLNYPWVVGWNEWPLATWQLPQYSGQDAHSNVYLGATISDTSKIKFIENHTSTAVGYTLSTDMTDVTGLTYGAGDIALAAWSSLILTGEGTVTLSGGEPPEPTVGSVATTSISIETATGHGNVLSDGGSAVTERGICWGTSIDPTIAGTHDDSGTGLGAFSVSLINLLPDTQYYARAYAINIVGIAYGGNVMFDTFPNKLLRSAGGKLLRSASGKLIRK